MRAAKKTDVGPQPFWPVRSIWSLALNNELTHRPAFDDTQAYFAIEGGRLAAYEITGGSQRWLISASPDSAPAAGDGLVFFVEDGEMVAVHATDGSRAWTTPLEDDLAAAPTWANGWLLVATNSGAIVALRAADGHEIWRRDLLVMAHAPIAVSADHVYVPLDNTHVQALQIETGEPVWDRRLGGIPTDILALDDRLFVGASDGYFYCLITETGRVDWRWHTGAASIGLPAVDEHRVYFVALDNAARALNRSNGVQQWMQLLKNRPIGGPLRAGSTVMVYGLQPPIRAMAVKDGKGGGDIAIAGPLATPPHIIGADAADPFLVVVTRDIEKGDTVTLFTRSVEPAVTPFTPFANPVTTVPPLEPGSAGL